MLCNHDDLAYVRIWFNFQIRMLGTHCSNISEIVLYSECTYLKNLSPEGYLVAIRPSFSFIVCSIELAK